MCIRDRSQPLLHPGKKLYPLRKRKKTVEKDHRINSGKMAEKNKTLFHQIKEVSALLGEKERLAQQNKTLSLIHSEESLLSEMRYCVM